MGWLIGAAVVWGLGRLCFTLARAAGWPLPRIRPRPARLLTPREREAWILIRMLGTRPQNRRLSFIISARRDLARERAALPPLVTFTPPARPEWDKDWNDYLPAESPGKRRGPSADGDWLAEAVLRSFAIPPAQLGSGARHPW